MLKDNPPQKGDFVKITSGEIKRVAKVVNKKDDVEIIFEKGGKALWKRDNVKIISRDESFVKNVETLRDKHNLTILSLLINQHL